jgi:hypothetical protein
VTHNLTLNLGVRWDLYFPESVNGPGNGALLNLRRLPARCWDWRRSFRTWAGQSTRPSSSRRASALPTSSIRRRSSAPVTDAASTPASSAPSSATPSRRTFRFWLTSRLNSPTNVGEAFNLATGPAAINIHFRRFHPTDCCPTRVRGQLQLASQPDAPDDHRRMEPERAACAHSDHVAHHGLCGQQGNPHSG